jgi:hypothetical protein
MHINDTKPAQAPSALLTFALALLVCACASDPSPSTTDGGVGQGAADGILFGDQGGGGDSGFADSGFADSGFADSGVTDAGHTDAGHVDAGQTDSGAADVATDVQLDDVDDAGSADSDSGCTTSCDDGVPCTMDVCKGGLCTHNIAPNSCYADGVCHAAGPVIGDPCRVCTPEKAQLGLQSAGLGTSCDDGSACTGPDACDGKGLCVGAAKSGCCKADLDCIVSDPCQVGVCDVGSGNCTTKGTAGCCKAGVCCDLAVGAPKASGASCGVVAVTTEWACSGAEIRRRQSFAGCDGSGPNACSSKTEFLVWAAFETVQVCDAPMLCVPGDGDAKPTCGVPPECKSAVDCNDGEICTVDVCTAGKCLHNAEKAGTPCGAKAIAAEYVCSDAEAGGKILVRQGVSTCDGIATSCPATSNKPVFGPWKTFKTCPWTDVCEVSDKSQPGICKGAPKCKPGTVCCDAKGDYAAKATACSEEIADEEYKCEGSAPGNVVHKRTANPGCSGSSTTCYIYTTSYYAWSPWQPLQTCGAKQACELDWNGKGSCTNKTQCAASAGCCSADGFYQAQGSACATSSNAVKTEKKCEGAGKGGFVLERNAVYGCSGQSGSCSYSSDNYVWGEWKQTTQCKPNEACDDSFGYVSCSAAGTCSPTAGCCDPTGEYVATGSKCKTSSSDGEEMRRQRDFGAQGLGWLLGQGRVVLLR